MYKLISYEIALGGDGYCESCGSSYNELRVETSDYKEFTISAQIGCTGGEYVEGLKFKELISSLQVYLKDFPEGEVNELITQLLSDVK